MLSGKKQPDPSGEAVRPTTLIELLKSTAGSSQTALAIEDSVGGTSVSYAALLEQAGAFDAWLGSQGVEAGDRVVFFTKNHPHFFSLLFACAARKATLVPLSPELTPNEIGTILADSKPKVILTDGRAEPKLAQARGVSAPVVNLKDFVAPERIHWNPSTEGAAEAPVIMIYTSGSTGHGKGVVLSQSALCSMAHSISRFYGYAKTDRLLCVLPFYHINAPMVTGLACFASGAAVVLDDVFGIRSAKFYWQRVHDRGITVLSLTPSIMATLLAIFPKKPAFLASIPRLGLVGTAKLEEDVWRGFEERFGIPCCQGYGLTETTTWITMTPADSRKRYGTAGIPVDCEIRIEPVPDSPFGEILVRTPAAMIGYNNQKKATRSVLSEGWFRTGDLGFIDDEGQLNVRGRSKNVIKRNGILILPEEIDDTLRAQTSVSEAKTIGVSHPVSGEKVVSAIIPASVDGAVPGDLGETLRKAVLEVLSPTKAPDQFIFLRKLPRNPIGKCDQRALTDIITGKRTEEIVSKFDRYEYRRAPSDDMKAITALIQKQLTQAGRLRFVGYWGVGSRMTINDRDIASLDRFVRLKEAINAIGADDFCEFEIVLADMHGRVNSAPEIVIVDYLAAVAHAAKERGIRTRYLSEIWREQGLDLARLSEEAASREFDARWMDFPSREDFIRQATNRPYNTDPEAAARRYLRVCLAERDAVAKTFADSVFFTFSPPLFKPILPALPVLYWHSIKPGVAEKPWFID